MSRTLARCVTLLFLATTSAAVAGGCEFGCCTICGGACRLRVEPATEGKTCYEIDCTPVCIPAVRFPWQKCCGPARCGRVRVVAKLKEQTRETPTCKYIWEPLCPACRAAPPGAAPPPAPTVVPAPPAGPSPAELPPGDAVGPPLPGERG